jgi:hypothetical protein
MKILQLVSFKLADNVLAATLTENKKSIEQALSDKILAEMAATDACGLCIPGD